MIVVGLTGAIGAGKSTLAELLAERGAEIIDVDAIGRAVIAPDGPGAEPVRTRFGTLDRRQLAAEVFSDVAARSDLESISWPLIEDELRTRVAASTAELVVLDMAVLAQGLGAGIYEPVVTVEADDGRRLDRLIGRGMSAEDARARMAAQVSEEIRRAIADVVVRNDGNLTDLAREADRVLSSLLGEPPADI